MTVTIEKETDITLDFDFETVIREVVEAASDYEKCPYETEVSVLLTDDEAIHQINREQRGIDRATDVLSFPLAQYKAPADFSMFDDCETEDYFNPESGELMLGDIVISLEHVKAQAQAYGHSEKRELAFLTAHSMLHLFGYDHMEDDERLVMEKRQEEILQQLDIGRD